ncbi:MAG TPA: hypothetical protein DIW24_07810 [Bacteroidetes bacterium]|nr:hypothetical protein [Bacteroidota bacterium]HRR10030.1 TolC family protein [Rhodothermales bacterium]
MNIRLILTLAVGFLVSASVQAQYDLVTLRTKALAHSPLVSQKNLLMQAESYALAGIHTGRLPKVQLSGQASYQSDVTKVSLSVPGITIPTPDKDQYRAVLEVSQVLYDGGAVKRQSNLQSAQFQTQRAQLDVERDRVVERVNQVYFQILMLDAQNNVLTLAKEELNRKHSQMEGMLRNGVGNPVSLDVLRTEDIRLNQRIIELAWQRKTAVSVLGILVGESIPENTGFDLPVPPKLPGVHMHNRTEDRVFSAQATAFQLQQAVLSVKVLPKVQAYAQGGYGQPGLNMFKSGFQPFGMVGLRFNWTLWDFNATRYERKVVAVQAEMVARNRDLFQQNWTIQTKQLQNEIARYDALLAQDEALIGLRSKIRQTLSVQLTEGVVTANEYLTELNNETQAKENKALREIQRLQALINYEHALGTSY